MIAFALEMVEQFDPTSGVIRVPGKLCALLCGCCESDRRRNEIKKRKRPHNRTEEMVVFCPATRVKCNEFNETFSMRSLQRRAVETRKHVCDGVVVAVKIII